MFFFVINHFNPKDGPAHLGASTVFSAALAAAAPEVKTVLVVDGSSEPDPVLAARLREVGAQYAHVGRSLRFAEGYNYGLAQSNQPWTILSASDVYASQTIFSTLMEHCPADPSASDIGCIIPRLTVSDLPLQQAGRRQYRRVLKVPLMTLNFNVFPTDYLRRVGGVPEEFSGNYNDVILSKRIYDDERSILLIPDRCFHYGSLTLASGKSNVRADADLKRFITSYPELSDPGSLWELDLSKFTKSPMLRLLAKLSRIVPARRRDWVLGTGMRVLLERGF